MMNSKNKTTKRKFEVNNFQVTIETANILKKINSLDSRVARNERQIKEINRKGNKND